MDVEMPELSGFEATKIIREQEKKTGKHLPIIAMTAHAMKGDRERCLAAGMDAYVTKPIQARDLWRAIEELMFERPLGKSSVIAPASPEVLDETAALASVGGDRQLLAEIVNIFLTQCPVWLQEIRAAIEQGEAVKLQCSAHALKGSVGTFGAWSAQKAAQRLETIGQDCSLSDAAAACKQLEIEIERLLPALKLLAK
jgi:HPt (histidine-containing phosphotransfer) domain-containing protein